MPNCLRQHQLNWIQPQCVLCGSCIFSTSISLNKMTLLAKMNKIGWGICSINRTIELVRRLLFRRIKNISWPFTETHVLSPMLIFTWSKTIPFPFSKSVYLRLPTFSWICEHLNVGSPGNQSRLKRAIPRRTKSWTCYVTEFGKHPEDVPPRRSRL